jgi:hypothetical protein
MTPEYRLGISNRHIAQKIILFATEESVFLNSDDNDQITIGRSGLSRFTLTGKSQPRSGLDPCGYGNGYRAGFGRRSRSPAGGAGGENHFSPAPASRANLRHFEKRPAPGGDVTFTVALRA